LLGPLVVEWTFPHERIWMSTTSRSVPTDVFDDNHGANKTLVHDGEVVIHIPNSGPAGGPHDFAANRRGRRPRLPPGRPRR
jgi:hypothetical protein